MLMAEVMSQHRMGLSAPASRQDVVSALLSAYGSSFGREDGPPSTISPVTADKELPCPPPRSDSLYVQKKPLPAVRRAEERMSMKFQLRVNEELPLSPSDIRTPRRKIQYRSLSREAKPPSLTLTVSNGSTAVVPPTPILAARLQKSPVPSHLEQKSLPSPPPRPPVKSDRRPSAQRSSTVAKTPKSQTELARNDSLLSQGEIKPAQVQAPPTDMATVVKRKALPLPAARKFKSLAELGAGPRAGKGGPMPSIPMPRPTTAARKDSNTLNNLVQNEQKEVAKQRPIKQQQQQQQQAPTMNELPPTPEDEEAPSFPVPAPPRKAFVGMGLPSNPRARGGPISPKHVRGKSSTGFNVLKTQRPAPPIPKKQEAITPEMTPSPQLEPSDTAKTYIIPPLSSLPPSSEQKREATQPSSIEQDTAADQRRPFSFETVKRSEPATRPSVRTVPLPALAPAALTVMPLEQSVVQPASISPQRPTSLDLAEVSPSPRNMSAPTQNSTLPPAESDSKTAILSSGVTIPLRTLPPSPVSEDPPIPPPFAPLTRQPIPMPTVLIPTIAPSQMRCYTKHSTSIWSNNTFQPMGCMICRTNDKDRKWTCTWCRLRICRNCSEELSMIPGRNLEKLVEARNEMSREAEMPFKKNSRSTPGIVVTGIGHAYM